MESVKNIISKIFGRFLNSTRTVNDSYQSIEKYLKQCIEKGVSVSDGKEVKEEDWEF